jgi:leader peptidase (prepilin peptidase) / N-methyltransferase
MGTALPGSGAAALIGAAALALVLATCTVADLRARMVPNDALAAGAAAALVLIVLAEPGALGGRAIAAAGAGGFLLAPALLRPGSIGIGDVKLAAVLGLYLGAAVVAALLVAFLAGTVTGVVMLVRHGPRARKMAIPFVPFMALGALVAIV